LHAVQTTYDISAFSRNQLMVAPGSKLAKTNGQNGLQLVNSVSHKRALIDARHLGKGTQLSHPLFVVLTLLCHTGR